jgi:6-phosphofructokinase 1
MKRIGILTGGGDCPGLNAVIRAVVRRAILGFGWDVIGIHDGFAGLVDGRCEPLRADDVVGLLTRGGTILGATNRFNPFAWPGPHGAVDRSGEVLARARELGLDAVVVVGGDGTMGIARRMSELGLPVVGVPKTIDNDLPATESTFGFNTAVETVVDALDRLATTAESHDRVMICEVMGRDTGWIAISSAIAGGAHVALIPEIPYDVVRVGETLRARQRSGRSFSVIVVAEGAAPIGGTAAVLVEGDATRQRRLGGAGHRLADEIASMIAAEVRVTVLGYVQRGGTPTAFDRLLGTRFGEAAVDLLAAGSTGRMVALRAARVESVPLSEVVGIRCVDPGGELVATARGMGMELGG